MKNDEYIKSTLPCREFVSVLPILALLLLTVNDHFLKGAGVLSEWITGKISDFAGLFFFPLLLTAIYNSLRFAFSPKIRMMARKQHGSILKEKQIITAIMATGLIFSCVNLSNTAADNIAKFLNVIFPSLHYRIYTDPTDLVALCVLPLTYIYGMKYVYRSN